ncbi:vomeronasal type-2 receptor 26-like [Bufo gargarizans]|uniref:vomeronasal type-2 receptor 26-like n=1 Tax=Bufo gargarizans TaxID=30331 RepID=UPI001CF4A4E4|nr:vomeronasal type-2 receptor 26-like [Bufo gargarizans]
MFAIEEINRRSDLLPNITLGYKIYDSGVLEHKAVQSALSILSGREEAVPNYSCDEKNNVVAFIGHLMSSPSMSIAEITGIYGYPQISYGAMDPIFSNKLLFPYFYRTVPDGSTQYEAIVLLLENFGWSWVGMVTVDDESSQRASMELYNLNQYIRRVHFITSGGDSIHLDEKGNFPTRFDLVNYQVFANQTMGKQTVGHLHEDKGHHQFLINESSIIWKSQLPPRSTCSESCLHGYWKVLLEGKQKCCYYCAPCAEGEISNQTDMETCLVCPNDHWSNGRRDSCVPRPIEFLSYGDTLGSSLIIINLTFCLVTIVVLGIFIKNKDSPIVKANNKNLSFILLLSLIFSFLCPLLFIGHPSDISCLLRQVTFGIIFSLAVSSVLAKTVTVVLAFQAIKPGRTLRQWMKRHLSTSLLVIGSSGEVLICVLWLFYSPPFPDYNTGLEVGKIILQCIEGSAIAFYLSIGYIGFLAMMSFIVAFLARRLPDTFNEAQYITFSMLVFCSVWISFIPAYLSTKGKDMVAVEVFAISCSSAGLLGCIFIPKCYIILLRPELNKKSNIRVIRRHCTGKF